MFNPERIHSTKEASQPEKSFKSGELLTSKENQEQTEFRRYIIKGMREALQSIKQQFEDSEDPLRRLPFHNRGHTSGVIRRTRKILEKIRAVAPELITEHEVDLALFSAAYHDVVRRHEIERRQEKDFVVVKRKTFNRINEEESADDAIQYMEDANKEAGRIIFSPHDKELVKKTIAGTITGFDDERKFIQPDISPSSPMIERILALADVGASCIEEPQVYLREGDAMFREGNVDIDDALAHPEKISDEQLKEFYRQRLLSWFKIQADFAERVGELALQYFRDVSPDKKVTEAIQNTIRSLFHFTEQSVDTARQRYERLSVATFEEIARDIEKQKQKREK